MSNFKGLSFLALSAAILLSTNAECNTADSIGYNCNPTCVPSSIQTNASSILSFGKSFAVLNLDVETGAVYPYENTTAGRNWISNLAMWIDTVHKQSPPPLSIFTTVAYVNSHKPELGIQSGDPVPFAQDGRVFGAFNTTTTTIYKKFNVHENAGDVVLAKARFYAGAGNQLEEILRAQKIDTVILSGIATSGVVLATALRLFDLDYDVYIITNTTIQAGTKINNQLVNEVLLTEILPSLPTKVITLEQAINALGRSGPAAY